MNQSVRKQVNGVATVNSDSSYTFTPTETLADGEHLLTIRIEDAQGNVLAVSSDRLLSIDTSTITQTVSIVGIDDDAVASATLSTATGSVTGPVQSGSTSDDTTPTINGEVSAQLGTGQVVAIYDGGVRLGTATVDGTNWSYTVLGENALTPGSHNFTAIIESSNGNESAASSAYQVIVQPSVTFAVDAAVASGQAQYVALYFPVFSSYRLAELEIFSDGVNLAAGLQPSEVLRNHGTANGIEYAYGGRSSNATDGQLDTSWHSSRTWFHSNQIRAGSWKIYDLGELTQIDQINLLGLQALHTDTVHLLTFAERPTDALNTSLAASQALAVNSYQAVTVGSGRENFEFSNAFAASTTPTLSGTLATALGADEELAVYSDGVEVGIATVAADLSWTFVFTNAGANPNALAVGQHDLVVQVQDTTNGSITNGLSVSLTQSVLVSGAPTQGVTIVGILDDQGADNSYTGPAAAGSVIDDTTPTLSGTLTAPLVAGQILRVFDGATELGVATVNGQSWSFTVPASVALATGARSFTARVLNPGSGEQGNVSTAFVVTVQQITIATLTDDTGSINGDLLAGSADADPAVTNFATDDTTPVIAGTLAAALVTGQTVVIYDDGVRLGTATVSNGTDWTYAIAALTTGRHNLVARLEDASGNVLATTASGGLILNVDAGTPTQDIAINTVVDNVAVYTATGDVANGTSTNDGYLEISGSINGLLTSAQVLAVYDGSTRLGDALVTDSAWTFTTPALAIGSRVLTARVENPATDTNGPASNAFTVIQQSVSVSSIADNEGAITADLLTSTNNAEAARYVRISNGNLAQVEVWALVDGTLTNVALNATVTAELISATGIGYLVDGDNTTNSSTGGWVQIDLGQAYVIHSIVATPLAVVEGEALQRVNVTASTSLLDLSALSAGQLNGNADITTNGISGAEAGIAASLAWTNSYQTDDATPTIAGTLGASLATSEVLGVYNGDVRIGQASVTDTAWTFTPTALAAGTHNLRLQVEDAVSGNAITGRASSTVITLTVDGTAPTSVSVNVFTVTDNAGSGTGTVVPNRLTDDTTPTLAGSVSTSLSANQRVAIYDDATFIGTALVNGTDWTFTPITPLSAGNHSLTAVVENTATGASGTVSNAATFVVQQVNVLGISDNEGLLQGNILDQTFSGGEFSLGTTSQTNDTTVTYSGTLALALDADQSLRVYDTGVLVGTASVDGTNWTFAAPNASYSTHVLSFQIEADANPGASLLATELTLNVNLDDPGFNLLTSGNSLNFGGVDRDLDLTLVSGLDQRAVQSFNLDNIAGITSGAGTNSLTLDIDDVLISGVDVFSSNNGFEGLDSGGRSQVLINGSSGTVDVEGSGWVAAGTTSYGGNDYVVYNFGTTGQLIIDSDIDREGAVL